MDVDFGDLEIGHHADGNRAYLSLAKPIRRGHNANGLRP